MWISSRAILVEVTSGGSGFRWRAPMGDDDDPRPGGWGLLLVDHEADRWGIQAGPPTTVWFEIGSTPAAVAEQGSTRR